jgi:hypothetical protein
MTEGKATDPGTDASDEAEEKIGVDGTADAAAKRRRATASGTRVATRSKRNREQLQPFVFMGKSYSIPTIALGLMGAGILLPSAKYSLDLNKPSPAEILVAICIALFSGLLFLWILDATGILSFRSEWVSRSVYGAAVVSILGTSVGVYKDAFSPIRGPLEGRWDLLIKPAEAQTYEKYALLLSFSSNARTYGGYSRFEASADIVAVEVTDFDPTSQNLTLTMFAKTGERLSKNLHLTNAGTNRFASSSTGFSMRLSRAN